MDIALAVEEVYKDAIFTRSGTYAELLATWKDNRKIPTQEQLADAWDIVLLKRFEAAASAEVDKLELALLRDDGGWDALALDGQVDLVRDVLLAQIPK